MKYKGDGYESNICEHHQDIVTCKECDIFKDGYTIKTDIKWYEKLAHPIQWLRLKSDIKRVTRL